MAKHTDDLRHISDNPTGAGDIPSVSVEQIEGLGRPGSSGGEMVASATGDAWDVKSRPGGQEGGAKSAGSVTQWPRPGGPEGWGS